MMRPFTSSFCLLSITAASLLISAPRSASAVVVTFNSDALVFPAFQPNGFQSVDSNLVSFSDSVGAGLALWDGTNVETNGTNALAVFGDVDGSILIMNFSVLMDSISLDFGNDDACCAVSGDQAVLNVFSGVTLVGTTTIPLTPDDLMNQTISYSGLPFDNATFAYTDATASPFTGTGPFDIGLTEIIDNVNVNPFVSGEPIAVPEPSTLALLGLGLVGFAVKRRRRAGK